MGNETESQNSNKDTADGHDTVSAGGACRASGFDKIVISKIRARHDRIEEDEEATVTSAFHLLQFLLFSPALVVVLFFVNLTTSPGK